MDNDANLINKYIEKLNSELCENVKKNVVLTSQNEILQEQLKQKEEEFFYQVENLKRELAEQHEAKMTELQKQHEEESKKIVLQRSELQKEANALRISNANLQMSLDTVEAEYKAYVDAMVKTAPKKRTRTAS